MSDPKIVTLLSGGLDSGVMAAQLSKMGYEVLPLSVMYGQRHRIELVYASALAKELKLEYRVVNIEAVRDLMRSCQTTPSIEVPEGHYADESMKATVSPNRNMIMLSIAAAYAITLKAPRIAYAAHAGDHPIYPDCRPAFISAMGQALRLCHYEEVILYAPFSQYSKAGIVKLGADINFPFHLTYSCYNGRKLHCGKCGTCTERREAFKLAEVHDPTHYETEDEIAIQNPSA